MGIQSLFNDPASFVRSLLLSLPGVLLALSGHEMAHAWVANRCGDPTARLEGRITLNPARHLDPVGFFCMLFVGIGWARPVPVNPNNFRHYRSDDLKVSLAGITANLIMFLIGFMLLMLIVSIAFSALPSYDLADIGRLTGEDTFYYVDIINGGTWKITIQADGTAVRENARPTLMMNQLSGKVYSYLDFETLFGQGHFSFGQGSERFYCALPENMMLDMEEMFQLSGGLWSFGSNGVYYNVTDLLIEPALGEFGTYAYEMVRVFMMVNLSLMVFNLIPLPPLDGYHVLNDVILKRPLFATAAAQRAGFLILLLLVMLGNVDSRFDVISIALRFVQTHTIDALTTAAHRVAALLSLF